MLQVIIEERVLEIMAQYEYVGIQKLLTLMHAPASQYSYVRKLLTSLVKQGVVTRLGYGKYGLSQTQTDKGVN